MAINYTWDVSTVDVKEIDGNADTVFNVHWRLTGTDNVTNESYSVYSSIALDTSDLSNFTAFADLTASDVQSWVEAAIGEDEIKVQKDVIDTELSTPTVQTKQVG